MPGLLFHHQTPTKDYIHDIIKPWVHYIPIREDLMDLKERYDWAESHPEEARGTSERATALIKSLGTTEGFEEMFRIYYEEPIAQVVGSYEPLANDRKMSWREVIRKEDGYGLNTQWQCGGYNNRDDCRKLTTSKSGNG